MSSDYEPSDYEPSDHEASDHDGGDSQTEEKMAAFENLKNKAAMKTLRLSTKTS
jgi:hypothetical protein